MGWCPTSPYNEQFSCAFPMHIPHAENAIVDIRKLRDYCLNPEHPEGKHKARLFVAALGMTEANAEPLHDALL